MPCIDCSKEDFYKSNVLPSLHVIASLTFQDIPDKKLPLIILLSRLSEIILAYMSVTLLCTLKVLYTLRYSVQLRVVGKGTLKVTQT